MHRPVAESFANREWKLKYGTTSLSSNHAHLEMMLHLSLNQRRSVVSFKHHMDRQFSWNLGTYASLTSFHPTVCKCTMPLHKWTGQGTFQASEYSAAKLSRLQHGQSLKANTKWTFTADKYCVGPVGTNRPAHTNKFLMKHTDSRFCHN